MLLIEYNIVYMTRNAIKRSVISNHLAENVVVDYEPLSYDFPGEDVLIVEDSEWWTMYFDFVVNAFSNGVGAIVISLRGK